MKIICAGYSKTGTKSLAAALRILGFTVYDYAEQFLEHGEQWLQILDPCHKNHPSNQLKLKEMLRRMYKDVDAVTDAPAYHFWQELLEAFPEAKIILMIREEKSWFQSLTNFSKAIVSRTPLTQLLWNMIASKTARAHISYARVVYQEIYGRFPSPKNISECLALRRYRAHNSTIIHRCPSESLLVFRLEDGWDPLCKFLNIPRKVVSGNLIKDGKSIPFPQKNVGNEGIKRWKKGNYPIPQKVNQEIYKFNRGLIKVLFVVLLIFLCSRVLVNIFFT